MEQIIKKGLKDLVISAPGFQLKDTLECGQCFRWEEQDDGSFCGIAGGKRLKIYQKGEQLILSGADQQDLDWWTDYFDLKEDYSIYQNALSFDPMCCIAMKHAGGIHILRQDPWETLCSFIISQNNNIPRIKGIIERLCSCFGEPMMDGIYQFPSAEQMAERTLEDYAPLRAGFRAKYLMDAARKVASGQVDFEQIQQASLQDAEAILRTIHGVGPKVAQCVLLFGFHKLDAFPIDVWMKKVLAQYYPDGFPEKARPYAGIAQQYLFHYERNCRVDSFETEK